MGWRIKRKPYPGHDDLETYNIDQDVLLGRGRDCQVLCLSMFVSRHHCQVKLLGERICVTDLGSSNGTFVNLIKVLPSEEKVLSVGDEIGIGNVESNGKDSYVFVVHSDDDVNVLKHKSRSSTDSAASSRSQRNMVNKSSNCAHKRFAIDSDISIEPVVISESDDDFDVAPHPAKRKTFSDSKVKGLKNNEEISSSACASESLNDHKTLRLSEGTLNVKEEKPKPIFHKGNIKEDLKPIFHKENVKEEKPKINFLKENVKEEQAKPTQFPASHTSDSMTKPSERRLSSLRETKSSTSKSTPSRLNGLETPALVTSTPCQRPLNSPGASDFWSPISKRNSCDGQPKPAEAKQDAADRARAQQLAAEEQRAQDRAQAQQLAVEEQRARDRTQAQQLAVEEQRARDRTQAQQFAEKEQRARDHAQAQHFAEEEQRARDRALAQQLAEEEQAQQLAAEQEQLALDHALAQQLAAEEQRAHAMHISSEEDGAGQSSRQNRSSTLVNFSIEEEVILIDDDEADFPASQMFDTTPNSHEMDQVPTESALDGSPHRSQSPDQERERELQEEIIIIDDDDDDDNDDMEQASRWFERLSMSQSSQLQIKSEPEDEAENEEKAEHVHDTAFERRMSDDRSSSISLLHDVRDKRRASEDAASTSSGSYDVMAERRVSLDRLSTTSKSYDAVCERRDSKDSSSSSSRKSSAKQKIDTVSEDDSLDAHIRLHEDVIDSSHDVSKSQHVGHKKKKHRRESRKENLNERKDCGKHREHDNSRKKETSSHHRYEDKKKGIKSKERIKPDSQKENGWRERLGTLIDDSDESDKESRPPSDKIPLVELTRVEDDLSLPSRFRLMRMGSPLPEPRSEEEQEECEPDTAVPVRDALKPGSRKIELTEPLPMPPRKAHRRGISASEATRMFNEQKDSGRTGEPVDKKDLRKQKLAEVAQRQSKETEKQGSKRGAAAAPAKVKVTASNRGNFLAQAEEPLQHNRPRSRQDVVRQMGRIPKLDKPSGKPRRPGPAKSPLETPPGAPAAQRLTEVPFLPPLEIPTGPQPKKRIAQRPPPGFNDDATLVPEPSVKLSKRTKSPFRAPVETPQPTPLNSRVGSSVQSSVVQVRSILKSASAGSKVKKSVTFKTDLVQIREIDRVPGTRPVSESRDAGLPAQRIRDSTIAPRPPFIAHDETVLQDVVYDISKWNPKWLLEEKKLPVGTVPPLVPNMTLPKIPKTEFVDFNEYNNTMYPLLMLDLWTGISQAFGTKESEYQSRNREESTMFMAVDQVISTPILLRPDRVLTTLHCHMLIGEGQREDSFPRLGTLVILDLRLHQTGGAEIIMPVFGYVTFDRQERIHPRTLCHKELLKLCPRSYSKFTFYVQIRERRNSPIVVDKPIRIKTIKYIRGDLRVFQALKYLAQSPLRNTIISPTAANVDFSMPDVSHRRMTLPEILNPSQEKMVLQTTEVCLQETPKICLIQGPPGTGKSHVIVSLVMQLLYRDRLYSKFNRDRGLIPRILLCAPSNNAVDVLAGRLLTRRRTLPQQSRFKMVRVGQPSIIHPDVFGVSLEELAKQDVKNQNLDNNDPVAIQTDISNWKAKLMAVENSINENMAKNKLSSEQLANRRAELMRGLKVLEDRLKNARVNNSQSISNRDFAIQRESQKKILRGADIVATTLSSCWIKLMETVFQPSSEKFPFDVCIVDEATQCMEAETLIPLMLGVKTLVLVGDPKQLSATIKSKVARDKGLATSLFARLQECIPKAVQLLDIQYRMHPEIIKWPNKYFYHHKLRTPDNFSRERSSKLVPYTIFSLPYYQDSRNGETNDLEAKLVIRMAELVIEQKVVENHTVKLGIITPYNNQKKLLLQYLERSDPMIRGHIEINTVDSFQGKEKDVIIMSCVRTTGIGFLYEEQRLNVALTRARYALFICGNFESLGRDTMWSNLLSDAEQRHCLVDISSLPSKDSLWRRLSK